MKSRLRVVMIGLLACSMMAWMATAADVTGTWSGGITDAGGGKHDLTFILRADGDKLTGTIVHAPPNDDEVAIKNGKVNGNLVSFETNITDDGKAVKLTYTAQVNGNQMEGKLTTPTNSKGLPFSLTKK